MSHSSNGTSMTGHGNEKAAAGGRDSSGRFTAGNKGGPAWMPDVTGADRLPDAFAEVLRSLRRSLLDALAGPGADQRHSATSADSKRDKRPGAA